jgi:hypothetical protein
MTNLQETEITFPISGGIFGVGPLATRLKALTEAGKIGPWHIGHWIDFRHTAIRIKFGTSADGEFARSFVENWHRTHAPVDGDDRSDEVIAATVLFDRTSMSRYPSNRIVRGLGGLGTHSRLILTTATR